MQQSKTPAKRKKKQGIRKQRNKTKSHEQRIASISTSHIEKENPPPIGSSMHRHASYVSKKSHQAHHFFLERKKKKVGSQ